MRFIVKSFHFTMEDKTESYSSASDISESSSDDSSKKTTKAKAATKTTSKTATKTKTLTTSKSVASVAADVQTVSSPYIFTSIDAIASKGIAVADINKLKEAGIQTIESLNM